MSKYKRIDWHDDALAYALEFGMTREDCEKILLSQSGAKLDPRSYEVGHLIVRYRAGDVVVVVGHREKDVPVIMSVWVDTHTEQSRESGSKKPGGSGSKLPKTMKQLTKMVLSDGFKIQHAAGHLKVVDIEGTFICTLPSTPSEYRSIANSWHTYNRAKINYYNEKRAQGEREDQG